MIKTTFENAKYAIEDTHLEPHSDKALTCEEKDVY